MSEELIQRNLVEAPEKMGDWNFYNIGATTLKALKGAKIIPDRDYDEYEKKKPDALIVKKPLVIAAIEYKQPKELRTDKQVAAAIAQELGTAQALQAKIYIVTDGKKSYWINPASGNEILQEDGSKITLNFDKKSTECITLINKIRASINATNDQIKAAATVDPLPLAEKVWQDLWAVSGATPENCLYTFVEIFIFKYLSDLGVLRGMYSFYDLLGKYAGNNDNEVLEYYASVIRVKIKELFPGNPKDKTTIINGTIFVSKDDKAVSGYATVFKRILNRFNDFGTLENIDYDFKSKLFETFLKESISKKNWGQYFTPLKVVRSIVNMVDIVPGMEICDPACGVGKFLLEPILHELHRYYTVEDGELKPQISLCGFDKGFDKDEQKTIILAKANMLIYMSGMIKEHPDMTQKFAQLFNDTFLLQTNSILGTLAKPIKDKFDLILTNPPYVMSGSSNLKEEISKQQELKDYFAISAMGIEGLFMEWIVRALKPNGKAFVVVPDGIMNRSNDKKLRNFILDNCYVDAVISLPLNTFFTTNKKTYILALTKKTPVNVGGVATLERQTNPVFTYFCSEIGETRDVYRFDIEQNDLETASDLFNMFKGAKTKFKTSDKRCKVVPIDDFYNGSHWSVDRWWTREEKIELGIEEEEKAIDLTTYISMINDTSAILTESIEPLQELIAKQLASTDKKKVSLSDKALFTLSLGKRLLKKDFITAKGDIPVYSANVFEPFVYTDKSNITDFSKAYVLWGIDGEFSFNVMERGTIFASTDHCGTIKILDDQIDPYYLAYIMEETRHKYGFDRGLRASLTNMKAFNIDIPIKPDGSFDLDAQKSLAESLLCLRQTRKTIYEKMTQLMTQKIEF
ncbi:N-6 DNA methylase [Faecalibacterium prausnitzii]|jgi:type I restriction-modification system methyltransferase subunit|uniref:N-6 DNA methylase n=1 Tax=Faecalibacterium prausnitzii TaxID=853 RepID=UPI001C02C2C2|nr:N-6 DNA methylase [Faecalibacterium prausnitzii]MBT9713539.1 N-6 DNA methylase [Faecalibacterium prausnitzii]